MVVEVGSPDLRDKQGDKTMQQEIAVDVGQGVVYCCWPNGEIWVLVDREKIGKTYRGETAWSDAERDAKDIAMERANRQET